MTGHRIHPSSSNNNGPFFHRGYRKKTRRSTAAGARRNVLLIRQGIVSFCFVLWIVKGLFGVEVARSRSEGIQRRLRASYDPSSSAKALRSEKRITFEKNFAGAPGCEGERIDSWKSISFTLVTQTSENRLWMLEEFCSVWQGDLSVAVFTNRTSYSIIERVKNMGCSIERVNVILLPPEGHHMGEEALQQYPVNKLRNLALAQVKTSHFLYLDIDFWPSPDLQAVLEADQMRRQIASLGVKVAFVVPVFQLMRQCGATDHCRPANILAMPRKRLSLVRKIKTRSVFQFDPSNYGGHGSTRYVDWVNQSPTEILEIPCVKSDRYEPYVVARYCNELPPFQEVFEGYGRNKMTWIMQLRRMGYRFFQISSFACHYPHQQSATRRLWNGNKNGKQLARPKNDEGTDFTTFSRGQVDLKYLEFKKWLLENVTDETRVPKCATAKDDDVDNLWISKQEANNYRRLFEQLQQHGVE